MIRRPATRIELKMEEDFHEYEEMKDLMKKENAKLIGNNYKNDKYVSELNFSNSSANEGSFSKFGQLNPTFYQNNPFNQDFNVGSQDSEEFAMKFSDLFESDHDHQ